MHIGIIPLLTLLASPVWASKKLGCYSSLPGSFVSQGEYTWQSSGHCTDLCSQYAFFALSDGNTCYCGSSAPESSLKTSDSACSVNCNGFPQEKCGGAGVYYIFSVSDNPDLSDDDNNDDDSEDNESSSSSSSSSTSSSTSSSNTQESSTSTISPSSTSTLPSPTTESSSDALVSSTDSSSTTSATSSSTSSSSSTSTSTMTTPPTSVEEAVHTSQMLVVENSSRTVTSIVYITKSSTPTPNPNEKSSSSSVNKGAIIGGVVGGVLGFLTLLFAVLFLLRHKIFSKYSDDDSESILADDVAYEEALKSNPFSSEEDQEADKILLGRRRLSDGSLADATDYGMKVLRVANPDDD